MLVNESFEEVRVFDGVASRTGVLFQRDDVRRSGRCCTSVRELIRKARAAGDGTFYLALNAWPEGVEQLELQKRWVVLS